jgi:hypothetical protein
MVGSRAATFVAWDVMHLDGRATRGLPAQPKLRQSCAHTPGSDLGGHRKILCAMMIRSAVFCVGRGISATSAAGSAE